MDFFEQQDRARRKTKWLIGLFALAVACIWTMVYLVCAVLIVPFFTKSAPKESSHAPAITLPDSWQAVWDPTLAGWVALGMGLVIGVSGAIKWTQLAGGGGAVAGMLGGRPVSPSTSDPSERRLLNVIEEMAIASGTPVPEVYLLDQEKGINAFAAGTTPGNAAIGVTQGAADLFDRDELQGVIAHEFSHILNGDMRLNIRLIGIVAGILGLAVLGRLLLYGGMHSGRGSNRGSGGMPLLVAGLAFLVIGSLGIFFGKLIKSAVSRQREYLADAAAVQFTRNPPGLSNALKKIGGLIDGSRLRSAHAEEASHLFFGNALRESWLQWFSTHPPLIDRIRAIEPGFDGTLKPMESPEHAEHAHADEAHKAAAAHATPGSAPATPLTAEPESKAAEDESQAFSVHASSVLPAVGSPNGDHLDFARKLLAGWPGPIQEAIHEPLGAWALTHCLVMSPDSEMQQRQWAALNQDGHPAVIREAARLLPHVRTLPAEQKLPLIDLTYSALRELSPDQYRRFRREIHLLIKADQQVDLFEYTLEKGLQRHLDAYFQEGTRKSVVHYYSLRGVVSECAILLSLLAHLGHQDPSRKEHAFAASVERLGLGSDEEPTFLPLKECNLPHADQALDTLAGIAPKLKRRLIDACAHTVASDGLLKQKEAELLRAIADSLDCPLPPFIKPSSR